MIEISHSQFVFEVLHAAQSYPTNAPTALSLRCTEVTYLFDIINAQSHVATGRSPSPRSSRPGAIRDQQGKGDVVQILDPPPRSLYQIPIMFHQRKPKTKVVTKLISAMIAPFLHHVP